MGYFGIKEFPYAVLVIFLPFTTIFFGFMCKMNYYPSFQVTSLAIASEGVKEVPSMEKIVEAYTPECLLADEDANYELESEKFEDARSTMTSRSNSRSNSGIQANNMEDLYSLWVENFIANALSLSLSLRYQDAHVNGTIKCSELFSHT